MQIPKMQNPQKCKALKDAKPSKMQNPQRCKTLTDANPPMMQKAFHTDSVTLLNSMLTLWYFTKQVVKCLQKHQHALYTQRCEDIVLFSDAEMKRLSVAVALPALVLESWSVVPKTSADLLEATHPHLQ